MDEAALTRRRARRSGDLAGNMTTSLNVSARGKRRLASPSQSRRDKAITAGAVDLSDDGEDEGAVEDDMVDLEASGTASAPVSPDESRRRRDRQRQLHRTQQLLAGVAQKSSHDQRRDRDNMTEFIEKKRQVFYTQMALDVKNGELQKLKKQSDDRIDWIRKMELLLEEDTVRFDTFFKDNHSATKESIQRSEAMTATKREKMSAIKHTMQHVQLEMTQIEKLRASVGECLRCVRTPSRLRCVASVRLRLCASLQLTRFAHFARALTAVSLPLRPPRPLISRSYKLFLDELTPERHFTQQGATLEQYSEMRMYVREQLAVAGISTAGAVAAATEAEAEEEEEEEEGEDEAEKRRASAIDDTARRCLAFTARHCIAPHFTDVQQLLVVFSDLQESDLFLVQNAQKLEDESEAVVQSITAFKARSVETTRTTERDIASLAASIEAAQQRLRLARNGSPVSGKSGASGKSRDEMLGALHGRVKHTYAGCGLSASGATTTTVAMLKELEAEFEKLNTQVLDIAESGGRGASSNQPRLVLRVPTPRLAAHLAVPLPPVLAPSPQSRLRFPRGENGGEGGSQGATCRSARRRGGGARGAAERAHRAVRAPESQREEKDEAGHVPEQPAAAQAEGRQLEEGARSGRASAALLRVLATVRCVILLVANSV